MVPPRAESEVPGSEALVPLPSQNPAPGLPKVRDAAGRPDLISVAAAWPPRALRSALEATEAGKQTEGETLHQSW